MEMTLDPQSQYFLEMKPDALFWNENISYRAAISKIVSRYFTT
jgi:hypothetical protein